MACLFLYLFDSQQLGARCFSASLPKSKPNSCGGFLFKLLPTTFLVGVKFSGFQRAWPMCLARKTKPESSNAI